MSTNNAKRISGILLAKENDDDEDYGLDLTIKTNDGYLINVNFQFERESVRDNLQKSLNENQVISVSVKESVDFEETHQYTGRGSIRIHDLSEDLASTVDESLGAMSSSKFSPEELAIIEYAVEEAKYEIQETFKPESQALRRIEARLDGVVKHASTKNKNEWRSIFVATVVEIAIDLGFGASIPVVLFDLFKRAIKSAVMHGIDRLLSPPDRP
jgi:hypothetical protein